MLILTLNYYLKREKRKEVLRNQFIPMKVQQKKPTVEEEEESVVSVIRDNFLTFFNIYIIGFTNYFDL